MRQELSMLLDENDYENVKAKKALAAKKSLPRWIDKG